MLIWIIAEEYGGRLAAAGRRLKEEDLGLSVQLLRHSAAPKTVLQGKVDREDLKTS